MKVTEHVRKYAAEQGIAEEEALKRRMEEKSREFTEKGRSFTPRREKEAEAFNCASLVLERNHENARREPA